MDDAPHYSGRLVTPHHHHPHHMAANTKEWHALEDTFWTSSPLPRRYNPAAQKEGKDPLAEHFTTGLSLRHDMDTTSTAPESQFEKQTFLKHHHSSMTVMARKGGGGADIIRKGRIFLASRGTPGSTRCEMKRAEDNHRREKVSGRTFIACNYIFGALWSRPIAKGIMQNAGYPQEYAGSNRHQVRINAKFMHVIQSWKFPEVDADFESVTSHCNSAHAHYQHLGRLR